MNLAGLILAGGKSQRMGKPKALLSLQGDTFLDRLIGTFSRTCSSVTVVLGHEAEIIENRLARGKEAQIVVNRDYELGQLSSFQCGLRALPPTAEAVLFTPVDYPSFRPETVELLKLAAQPGDLLVIPRRNGKRGHPVLAHVSLIAEFLALPVTDQARTVVHRYRDKTRYVDVEDEGVVADVDEPADYSQLLTRFV